MTGDGQLFGEEGDDRLFAGIGNSRLDGGNGDDILVGGTGRDTLLGGAGQDIVIGDPPGAMMFGNDVIDGGPGDDLLAGGGGADVFVFRATGDADVIARFGIDWLDPAATLPLGRDFAPGLDRIAFEPGTFATADEVAAATETEAGSAVIRLGSASLTVFGVTEAELTADSFVFGEVIA
jgi:Ca2+-binding RTX toxin-like protein